MNEIIRVDPRTLRVQGGRIQGADPWKLQLQIAHFGRSLDGMPPLEVYRAKDGELVIYNGTTRATRAAKLCPGELVTVEVIGLLSCRGRRFPTIEDVMP